MKRLTLLFSLLLVLASGCIKKNATITGRLFENCTGGPLVNAKVTFRIKKLLNSGKGEVVASATTDENGFFTVTYKSRPNKSMTMLVDGQEFVTSIPSRKNIFLGTLYMYPSFYPAIRLQVNNSYAGIPGYLRFSGSGLPYPSFSMQTPLHDTVFPATVPEFHELTARDFNSISSTSMKTYLYWALDGTQVSGESINSIPYCSATPDTIVVTID